MESGHPDNNGRRSTRIEDTALNCQGGSASLCIGCQPICQPFGNLNGVSVRILPE
jgi:hypothetical protein